MLPLKTQAGGEVPSPRPLHEQVAGRVCLSVSLCLQSRLGPCWPPSPVFPGDPFLRIKCPPPLTIIPPNESALVFPGTRSFSGKGLTPLPPFVPGHSLQAFPTWARPPPNPSIPPAPPFPTPSLPSAPSQEAPGESSLCQLRSRTMGPGSVFLLKRRLGLGKRQEPAITGPTMGRRQGASVN